MLNRRAVWHLCRTGWTRCCFSLSGLKHPGLVLAELLPRSVAVPGWPQAWGGATSFRTPSHRLKQIADHSYKFRVNPYRRRADHFHPQLIAEVCGFCVQVIQDLHMVADKPDRCDDKFANTFMVQ